MTEEAKKKIENVYKYSSNSIEKIEAAKFGYALASQERREEWVRVEDRLPEEKDADPYGFVYVWRRIDRQNGWPTNVCHSKWDRVKSYKHTHWMPLPTPPTK